MTHNQAAFAFLDLLLNHGLICEDFIYYTPLKGAFPFIDKLVGRNLINRCEVTHFGRKCWYYSYRPDQLRSLMKYHKALCLSVQQNEDARLLAIRAKQNVESIRIMTDDQLNAEIAKIRIIEMLEWADISINPHLDPFTEVRGYQSVFTSITELADSYRLWAFMEGYRDYSSFLLGIIQNKLYTIYVYHLTEKSLELINYSPDSDRQVLENWNRDAKVKHFVHSDGEKIERSCIFCETPTIAKAFLSFLEERKEQGTPLEEKEFYMIPYNERSFSYLQMLTSGVISQRATELCYRKSGIHLPKEIVYRCDGHDPFDFADKDKTYIADLCNMNIAKIIALREKERDGIPYGILMEPWQKSYIDVMFNDKHVQYYLYDAPSTAREKGAS